MYTMNGSETINSRCLEAEQWVEKFSQFRLFEVLEETRQKKQEKIERASSSNRTEQEQNKELQSQLVVLKRKQDTLANEHNSIIDQTRQLESDRLEQEESAKAVQKTYSELEEELQGLEKQRTKLEKFEESDATADNDELLLALFHGLGVQSKIEGDKVKTVLLTTSNEQDILALALHDHRPEFTANYVWNFISK